MTNDDIWNLLCKLVDEANTCRESLFSWCQDRHLDDSELALVFRIAAGEEKS